MGQRELNIDVMTSETRMNSDKYIFDMFKSLIYLSSEKRRSIKLDFFLMIDKDNSLKEEDITEELYDSLSPLIPIGDQIIIIPNYYDYFDGVVAEYDTFVNVFTEYSDKLGIHIAFDTEIVTVTEKYQFRSMIIKESKLLDVCKLFKDSFPLISIKEFDDSNKYYLLWNTIDKALVKGSSDGFTEISILLTNKTSIVAGSVITGNHNSLYISTDNVRNMLNVIRERYKLLGFLSNYIWTIEGSECILYLGKQIVVE